MHKNVSVCVRSRTVRRQGQIFQKSGREIAVSEVHGPFVPVVTQSGFDTLASGFSDIGEEPESVNLTGQKQNIVEGVGAINTKVPGEMPGDRLRGRKITA